MGRYTESVVIRMSRELHDAIEKEAERRAIGRSTLIRSTLKQVFMTDEVMIERYGTLIDASESYSIECAPEQA